MDRRRRPRRADPTEAPPGPWARGAPEQLPRGVRALAAGPQVECIDLYQLHAPDPRVPFGRQRGALAELRRAGKSGGLGLSNVDVARDPSCPSVLPIVTVQNHSASRRWPLTQGVLAYCGMPGSGSWHTVGRRRRYKAMLAADRLLGRISRRHGVSPSSGALDVALLAQGPGVISDSQAPGPRRMCWIPSARWA